MPIKDEDGSTRYLTGHDENGEPVYMTIHKGDFPMGAAPIASLAIAWALFVPYTMLFTSVMRNRRKGGPRSRAIVAISIVVVYVLSVGILIVDIFDVVNSFAFHKSNSIEFFLRESNPVSPTTNTMLFICSTTTDALFIWRLYVIWDSKIYPIVLPALAWAIAALFGPALLIVEFMGLSNHHYTKLYFTLSPVYFGLTFVVNVSVTCLIIGKIWWVQRRILPSNVRTKRLARSFARAVIESGVIYTVCLVAYTILWITGYQGAVSFLTYPYVCILGIAPTLIIYRLQNVEDARQPTPAVPLNEDPEKNEPLEGNGRPGEVSELVWNVGGSSGGSASAGKKAGERHKSNFFFRNGTPTKKARHLESMDVGSDSFFDGITDSTGTTSTAISARMSGTHVVILEEGSTKDGDREDDKKIKKVGGKSTSNTSKPTSTNPSKKPKSNNVLVVPLRPEETISAEVVYIDGDATGTLMLPETSIHVPEENKEEKPQEDNTQIHRDTKPDP